MNNQDIIYYIVQFLDPDSYLMLSLVNHFINQRIELICKQLTANQHLYGLDTYVASYVAPFKIKSKCQELGIQNMYTELVVLYHRNLKVFPREITFLYQLTKIYLSANCICSVPSTINKLSNLQTLYFYHNNFNMIPNEIYQLYNLRSLNFNSVD